MRNIAASADGTRIASSSNSEVMKWDWSASQTFNTSMSGHSATVSFVAASKDRDLIVPASEDDILQQWDVATGKPLGALIEEFVLCIAIRTDDRLIVSGSEYYTVCQWDELTGHQVGDPT